jgi:cytochrome c oxidase subunit I
MIWLGQNEEDPVQALSKSQPGRLHYLNERFDLGSWLATRDHKRVAWLYLVTVSFFFLAGLVSVSILRLESLTPRGDLVEPGTYARLFTLHGSVMVWLFLVPALPGVLGNFLVPLMIGARGVAFPRLNLAGWYLYLFGGVLLFGLLAARGLTGGWVLYSSNSLFEGYSLAPAAALLLLRMSAFLLALNLIVTIHRMRAAQLSWSAMPIFVWGVYLMSLIQVITLPVLATGALLVVAERIAGIGLLSPTLGGDSLLAQHFVWFFSHAVVYSLILPAIGIVTEIISTFTRTILVTRKHVIGSLIAITFLGTLIWGHHLLVSTQSPILSLFFSALSFLIVVPFLVILWTWLSSLYGGSISYAAPMLYALAFIGVLVIGGSSGLILSTMALTPHLDNTYFVVAHFHYLVAGALLLAYLAGIHYWWPKMTGRLFPDGWGAFAALLTFVGVNLTFLPLYLIGYMGLPRRHYTYPAEFQTLQVLVSAGATLLVLGYLLPAVYLFWSLFYGAKAPADPWGAETLEWRTSSPPPSENFEDKVQVQVQI